MWKEGERKGEMEGGREREREGGRVYLALAYYM